MPRKHHCKQCGHAPFESRHGLVVHVARMHKSASEPATAGKGSSTTLHACEHCTAPPFKSKIALGLHRRKAHGIASPHSTVPVAALALASTKSARPITAMTLKTRPALHVRQTITDMRITPVPQHELKFCPGCAFPVRDLIDGAHAEGSPFRLQVCPCCLFPMDVMLTMESALQPPPTTIKRHETTVVTGWF